MPFFIAFWKPIALGVAAILLVVAIGVWKHHYDEARRDEGRAEIQPKLDASIKAEHDREQETAQCVAASKVQSDAITAAAKRAADAQAESAALIAKAQADARKNAARVSELKAIATAAPKPQSCEAELREADMIVSESLKAGRQ